MAEEAPQNDPTSFMISDEQAQAQDPFIVPEAGQRVKGREDISTRANIKRPEVKKETKEKAAPSVFSGAYGTAKTKLLAFDIGKKDGYYDFKSHGVSPTVRQKMVELKERLFPKGQEYTKKYNLQMEVNKIKRELGYKSGDDHTATVRFLKEVADKTGIN